MIDEVLSRVIFDLIVVLLAAKIGGWLAEKIGQPSVLGELLVGLILGPSLLGFINPFAEGENAKIVFEILTFLGKIGIMLLLFQVGLESNIYKLIKCGITSLIVATIGVTFPIILGFAFCFYILGLSLLTSIFIGATLVATSVGITMRVLRDNRKLNSNEGRIILGAAVIDDVMGLVILSAAMALVTNMNISFSDLLVNTIKSMLFAVIFLVGSIWIGIKFVPKIFRWSNKLKIRRTFVISSFIIMLIYGYAANLTGLAPIVGAFAAGLIFERSEEKEHFEDRIKPVANIFVPVFFVMAGVYMNVYTFGNLSNLLIIISILSIAIFGKMISGLGAIKKKVNKLTIGIGMIPRGEVGLIAASYGLATKVFTNEIYSILILVIMLTTFITPPLLVRAAKKIKTEDEKENEMHEHVM
jgi:Kef-type K+ transport system membrane component KefB